MLTGQRNVPSSSSSALAAKQGEGPKTPSKPIETRRVAFKHQNIDDSAKFRVTGAHVGCSTTQASVSAPNRTAAKSERSPEEALRIADCAREKTLIESGLLPETMTVAIEDDTEKEALDILERLLAHVDFRPIVLSPPRYSLKRKREDEDDETESPQVRFCPFLEESSIEDRL